MYAQVENSLMSDMAGLDWIPLLSVVVYMVAAPLGLCRKT